MKRLFHAFLACTLALAAVQGALAFDAPPDTGQRTCEKARQPGPGFTLWLKIEKQDLAAIEHFELIAEAPQPIEVSAPVLCPLAPPPVVALRGAELDVYHACHPVLYERPPGARASG
jgi:hypothetical protein